MKYVMLEADVSGVKKRVPVIFPDFISHDLISESISSILTKECKAWTVTLGRNRD